MEDSSVSTRMSQEQKLYPSENAWNNFSVGEDKKKTPHGFPDKDLGVRMRNGTHQRSPPLCPSGTKYLLRNKAHPTLSPQIPHVVRTFATGENFSINLKENHRAPDLRRWRQGFK